MAVNELLIKTCEYIQIESEMSDVETLESRIAKRVLDGEITEEQATFVEEVFKGGSKMEYVQKLITPVSDKEFTFQYNRPTEYFPSQTPMDSVAIKDGNPHWIYIHSECQGRYGETYWISDNCSSSLNSLPTLKVFKEFDFEVGHFYKITCTDEIHWGNGRRKYLFEIKECTEEEYMRKGFISDADDRGWFDKCYMEDIIRTRMKMSSK